jgi:hypothetical protein
MCGVETNIIHKELKTEEKRGKTGEHTIHQSLIVCIMPIHIFHYVRHFLWNACWVRVIGG